MATIQTKAEFLNLWNHGLLGNKLRSWDCFQALEADPQSPYLVNMRTRQTGNSFVKYGVIRPHVPVFMRDWNGFGVKPEEVFFNEPAPDEELVVQGYLMRSTDFFDLDYNEAKLKMRDAMMNPKSMSGSAVMRYLRPKMTQDSWDDLNDLFDQYPDDVVEFGIYQNCLGHLPGRNLVIWEVRSY